MILVVEDHSDVSAALRRLLKFEGYAVHVADCGTDALDWLRSHHPRLVLMDHMMPDMSGVEVVQQAVSQGLLAPERVVFYTAAPAAVAPSVISLGLGGCIPKGTEWEAMRIYIAEQMLKVASLADPANPAIDVAVAHS